MASTPNAFGSLSYDTYRSPGTVTGSAASNFTPTDRTAALGGTMVNSHKLTEVYDPTAADGTNEAVKSDFTTTDAPPIAPNYAQRGRDYYTTGGFPTETYLDNSNGPASVAPDVEGGPATL